MRWPFPKTHVIIAAGAGLCLCCSLAAVQFAQDPQPVAQAKAPQAAVPRPGLMPSPEAPALIPAAPARAPATETVQVRPGENLSLLFKRRGLSPRELHELVSAEPFGPRLKNIFPGHQLSFSTDLENRLVKLTYSPGPLQKLEFTRIDKGFKGVEIVAEPERVAAYRHGVIQHSLFVASQRAGLDDSLTMRLAQIFQWDIDFVLDIRAGDAFHVLFEELRLDGNFISHGEILAAEFINQGERHRAVLYTDASEDSSYYTPDGRNVRKAFLRAPVSFTRISSNFNLNRKHPLWKSNMPHRGIDYAAPRGTPILASGEGRVIEASRTPANGNYIVIRHGEQFVTKYLHLSKFVSGLRVGASVKQGQTIGYVGATGWATGPHLHYEFLVNGIHRNPRTVKLPDADPVPAGELDRFSLAAQPLLAQLDGFKQDGLAQASGASLAEQSPALASADAGAGQPANASASAALSQSAGGSAAGRAAYVNP